jgi:hypothetical protein
MKLVAVLSASLLLASLVGCGPGKPHHVIAYNNQDDAWPTRDRPGKGLLTVQIGKPGEPSWAGRKVKVTIQASAGITVDPAETELTLDETGSASVQVVHKAKAPPTNQTDAYSLTITVTGPENFTASLPAEVYVRKEPPQ